MPLLRWIDAIFSIDIAGELVQTINIQQLDVHMLGCLDVTGFRMRSRTARFQYASDSYRAVKLQLSQLCMS